MEKVLKVMKNIYKSDGQINFDLGGSCEIFTGPTSLSCKALLQPLSLNTGHDVLYGLISGAQERVCEVRLHYFTSL